MKGTSDAFLARLQRDMTTGFLHLLVLEHVRRLGPIHGYGLIRAMDDAVGEGLWKEGTVYPLLGKLEAQGLVRSRWGDAPTGPRRKEYTLTPAGQDVLDVALARWRRLRDRLDAVFGEP